MYILQIISFRYILILIMLNTLTYLKKEFEVQHLFNLHSLINYII